jgi:hypothetical protein
MAPLVGRFANRVSQTTIKGPMGARRSSDR